MEKRWIIIQDLCPDSILLEGAGEESVNGTYCLDGQFNGYPVWTKVGGTRFEDSIFLQDDTAGSDDELVLFWLITSGGTIDADPENAKYRSAYFPDYTGVPVEEWLEYYGDGPAPTYGADPDPVYTQLRQVYPIGDEKWAEEEDLSFGLIAKRRKLNSDLVFTGDDYDWLLGIERDNEQRCEKIIIRHQWKCNGKWETFWTGSFSPGSGSWDFDKCTFVVRPSTEDKYTCIVDALDANVNILNVAAITVNVVSLPSLEFHANFSLAPGTPMPSATGWDEAHSQTLDYTDCGDGSPSSHSYTIWWREVTTTECVAGVAVPPPGDGWIQVTNCATGFAKWARPPLISWTFGDAVVGPSTSPGDTVTPPDTGCANWLLIDTVAGPTLGFPSCPKFGVYICLDDAESVEFDHERLLYDALKYMIQKSGCDRDALPVSDFFEWNPPGDAPGYSSGVNYVTGGENQLRYVTIGDKSDNTDIDATNPATIGNITLREMFAMLASAFRVFWDIDSDGNFRFEHWRYWTYPVGLVLSDYDKQDRSEPRAYSHLQAETPRYERAKWMEAQGRDFIGMDIVYSGPCVSTEPDTNVEEVSPGRFTTDIPFCLANPDAVSDDGFTLMACSLIDETYNCILDFGAISGTMITNAPLSWGNLQRDYWTWDRYLFNATMNGASVEFDGIRPNIEQRGVSVRMCCAIIPLNSSHRVDTLLGDDLGGIYAFIRRMEIDGKTGMVSLTLRYAY